MATTKDVEWCRKYLGAEAENMTDAQVEKLRDYWIMMINSIFNEVLYANKVN